MKTKKPVAKTTAKVKFLNSQEEYFYYWLEELELHGYVKNIKYNLDSFVVNNPLNVSHLKAKSKSQNIIEDMKLIKERSYTPDFIFEFTSKSEDIFYFKPNSVKKIFPFVNNDNKTYVDTKGEFTQHYSSTITFGDRQAMMWDKHKIYVQIIKPYIRESGKNCLFEQTFVPSKVMLKERYIKDMPNKNIKKGDTKIKFVVNTFDEFIKNYK